MFSICGFFILMLLAGVLLRRSEDSLVHKSAALCALHSVPSTQAVWNFNQEV